MFSFKKPSQLVLKLIYKPIQELRKQLNQLKVYLLVIIIYSALTDKGIRYTKGFMFSMQSPLWRLLPFIVPFLPLVVWSPHIWVGRHATHAFSKMPFQHWGEPEPAVCRGWKGSSDQRFAGHCDVLRCWVSGITFFPAMPSFHLSSLFSLSNLVSVFQVIINFRRKKPSLYNLKCL